ncbi:MAG: CAP domain-containing protein [Armatimonadota bacterium]
MRFAVHYGCYLAIGGAALALTAVPSVFAEEMVPPAPVQAPAVPTPSTAKALPAAQGEVLPTPEEVRFVELANQERARRGLGKLTIDPLLIRIARKHSQEMMEKDYFSHTSPTRGSETPLDRYRVAVPTPPNDYACVGENLYYCTVVDVQRGHSAFMTSPKHRENVLFPRFEKIGVGIITDQHGKFWVTQMFLTNTPPEVVAKNRKVSKR